ncbi:calpain-like protein [Talaromyces stipitatus ATCC 10500]|uniref:Calpain-like protein n=1 Tax=Talaromyces stipitatus (strain ATCC 10500 / CBS 375.48 / QM 6759 / NRRL 1006) TaxID=441959 RepID=B8M361_TALSN|nr:calpain-like protein [Talaromyces stipitatus ATCC 10500]EED22037.1 calpain-like protein [Talaromyces stipitatus ATCC 10500]
MDREDEVEMLRAYSQSPRSGSRTPRNTTQNQAPQETIKQFWDQFNTRYPGKIFTILPDNPYARSKAAQQPTGVIQSSEAVGSYEQARKECEIAVERIVRECERINQKYSDPHFDIEFDLKTGKRNCLDGLAEENMEMRPRGVKRVTDIFEHPQFYINGPTAGDVRQGRDGDCWLMAALCTLGNKEGLIDRLCVAQNEKVGVYGFVFYRDGEWQQCIIDDKLYLRAADYDESIEERPIWDDINRKDTEEEYRKVWQTGSRALYFAQCSDENETWLPLLEKAYAKAHGDYTAIEGGFVGEAIEDLTGGVTSEILSTNILDKDKFWKEELMNVNKQFLFGCATGIFSNWLDPKYRGPPRERKGISEGHSYSIMEAKEINGVRLLRLRNPWGKKEWSGAWSDGSEEWTPEWMNLLNHKFGNDGVFWISYDDLLKKYQHLDRTRLFGPEWTVTQQWMSLNVPWSADYHHEKFVIEISRTSPVVVVLSQLDTRYFRGLEGEYDFTLQFRLQKEGEEDYIVRSSTNYMMSRSVNTDITLDAGKYCVLVKVTAYRRKNVASPEEVVRVTASRRREKLVQIGLSYDLAHTKGLTLETEAEKREREEREERQRFLDRQKLREQIMKKLQQQHIREKKIRARRERMMRRERLREALEEERALHAESADDAEEDFIPEIRNGHEDLYQPNWTHHENELQSAPTTRKARVSSRPPRPNLKTSFPKSNAARYQETMELLQDFEFDSDLDMPPENSPTHSSASFPGPPPRAGGGGGDGSIDPWNAVCIVGLKVFSKDPELKLQVVRPGCNDGEAPLDRDDPAVSATFEKRTSWLT